MTQDELKRQLYYDLITGKFIWLNPRQKALKGKPAGYITDTGYVVIHIGGERHRAHRLAWFYMTGKWPRRIVDHANNIRHNNAWFNLRLANNSQNRCNKVKAANNTSGFKGVSWHRYHQKYAATITHKGKKQHLGYYTCPEKAHKAYRKAAKKLHGKFANCGE